MRNRGADRRLRGRRHGGGGDKTDEEKERRGKTEAKEKARKERQQGRNG
jgi:hypothetical protein